MKKDAPTPKGRKIDGIFNGLPYEGPTLNLKKDDPPHMQPRLVCEVSVRTFMMNNPKDVKEYEQAMEDVGRGWSQISKEEMVWIDRQETWKIFLRLMNMKYIEPEDLSRVTEKST
jgi:hypothetical protein